MNRAFLLLTFAVLTACSTPQPTAMPVAQWTKHSVVGLSMELIDPIIIEQMSFFSGGAAPVTHGRRKGRMNEVSMSLFHWAVVSGRLRIFAGEIGEDRAYEELTLILRDSSTITAQWRSGQVVKYRYHVNRNG